jgi:lysophospholipase L1-like esterase
MGIQKKSIRLVPLFIVLMLSGAVLARAAGPSYYLALGDSLAQGIQWSPTGDIPTNHGYADDLHALLRLRDPGLTLVKLGCSGETTTSMIAGGNKSCGYAGPQLAAAVAFLENNKVDLVTLDIGANDIDACISLAGVTQPCALGAASTVASNLLVILNALRAASPHTLIVGMNYYDPFLAAYTLLPVTGPTLAQQSLVATVAFNTVLGDAYALFYVPVADVATAFQIVNSTPIPFLRDLPLNVFLTLSWTWMLAPPPFGPDVHPNDFGYAVIAGEFAKQISLHPLPLD